MKLLTNTYNRIILATISIFGFATSCRQPVEYGTPYGKFICNAKVVSLDTQESIKNILATTRNDSLITDENGEFTVLFHTMGEGDLVLNIKLKDIDDTINGSYEDLDTTIEFNNLEYKGGDGSWDNGTATENIELYLKQKQSTSK